MLKLLDVLLPVKTEFQNKRQVLQEEFDIPDDTKKFAEEVAEMCNLSKGVMEQGMAKGRLSALLEAVEALMDSAQVSAEKAMDMLKISGEDRTALNES